VRPVPQGRPDTFDVAIIGYGPTGASLANLLALCGLSVAVIERARAIYDLPRAVHFDGETMRVFQTIGIAEELRSKVRVNPGMRFVAPDGTLLLDWPRPKQIGPQGWHPSYRFHQPDLEKLLRAKAATCENIHILTGTAVTKLSANADNVVVVCDDLETSQQHEIRARYCVGCDGANSMVRDAIGTDMEDLGFAERWLVVDVLLNKPRTDLGDHTVQFCDPDRAMTYCRNSGNRRRWEIAVKPDEADSAITAPDRIWQFLSRWIGPDDAELERHAVYTFRSMVARKWQSGRVFIAGDAAHLTPPFMGQGMCAGIRDAANLAWKLAAVLNTGADPDILTSYQSERAPNARTFIETAVQLGKVINAMDSPAIRPDPASGRGAMFKSILPPLGPSCLLPGMGQPGDPTGQLFPQPRLSDGRLLDDAVGYAPVLLSLEPLKGARLPHLDGQAHPEIAQALRELGVAAAILRPDRYVGASARTQADVARLARMDLHNPVSARSATQ
jgi:3-(3-hydroxy-phenyl)propionate hydroxylase